MTDKDKEPQEMTEDDWEKKWFDQDCNQDIELLL